MTQAAGKLNHRIRLESVTTTQDSNGDTVEEWVFQSEVWAEVAPLSAREFVAAGARQSKVVGYVTLRYKLEVQPNWRFWFRGQYYDIEGVLPDKVSGLEYMTLPYSVHIINPT